MIWEAKKFIDREFIIKTRFALFPKRIDGYKVWLQRYYVTYDWAGSGLYGWYTPTFYITKKEAEIHVRFKKELRIK